MPEADPSTHAAASSLATPATSRKHTTRATLGAYRETERIAREVALACAAEAGLHAAQMRWLRGGVR